MIHFDVRKRDFRRLGRGQPQGQPVTFFDRRVSRYVPFRFEQAPVLQHGPARVDLLSFESLASEVMHKCVLSDARFESSGERPETKIVIFKIAAAELLVQSADALDDFSPRQETKADQSSNFQ